VGGGGVGLGGLWFLVVFFGFFGTLFVVDLGGCVLGFFFWVFLFG